MSPCRKNHRNPTQGGFTLVEVIISIVILILLSGALFSLLSSLLDTRRTMLDRLRRNHSLAAWDAFLRDTLASFPREGVILGYHEPGVSSTGSPNLKIEFLNVPLHIGPYAEYGSNRSYYLKTARKKEGVISLQLVAYPEDSEISGDTYYPPITLLRGLQSIKFEFYDAFTGQWESEWSRNNQKPRAIRSRIVLSTGETQELIVWIPNA